MRKNYEKNPGLEWEDYQMDKIKGKLISNYKRIGMAEG